MKYTFATMALVGLVQSCSIREEYYKNDPTCTDAAKSTFDETWMGETMNTCQEDTDEGEYGMITGCSGGVFVWAAHGEDSTCSTVPGVYTTPSGACLLSWKDDGDNYYQKITIIEEEVAPIKTLLNLLQE